MTDRIRTVDMSDPAVVLDCYLKLNVAYKELKAENAKLRAALQPFADIAAQFEFADDNEGISGVMLADLRTAAAALKETGDE